MNSAAFSSADREIELAGHLPGFMAGFREMKAIFAAEDPELRAADKCVKAVRDAGFIEYCGERFLSRLEKMLGIFPLPDEDISERRQRVLIRWNESPPYTLAALYSKLTAICGEGNFTVRRDLSRYQIVVFVSRLQGKQLDELARLLALICPANLVVKIENRADIVCPCSLSLRGTAVYTAVIGA